MPWRGISTNSAPVASISFRGASVIQLAGQVARVVVGDPRSRERGAQRDPALRDQLGEQLAVVVDGLLESEPRILVAQGVERVRIGREDGLELGLGEHAHVLLDQHLEQALLADPAHVVAGVALAVVEQAERDAGVVQDLRHAP